MINCIVLLWEPNYSVEANGLSPLQCVKVCVYFAEVKNLASDLLSKWMAIFKDGQAGICYTLHCFISCLLRHIIM